MSDQSSLSINVIVANVSVFARTSWAIFLNSHSKSLRKPDKAVSIRGEERGEEQRFKSEGDDELHSEELQLHLQVDRRLPSRADE